MCIDLLSYKTKKIDLNKYKETRKVFKFEYMGEKDLYYKIREVIVKDIYMKNGYEYIKAWHKYWTNKDFLKR